MSLLTRDETFCSRYIFTCRYKNVLSCNDDLLHCAITTIIGAASFYFSSLVWFSGFNLSGGYHVCVGRERRHGAPGYGASMGLARRGGPAPLARPQDLSPPEEGGGPSCSFDWNNQNEKGQFIHIPNTYEIKYYIFLLPSTYRTA